eukprot:XP_001695493.1 predicted protein [Chlamydomonas reinhardtii]
MNQANRTMSQHAGGLPASDGRTDVMGSSSERLPAGSGSCLHPGCSGLCCLAKAPVSDTIVVSTAAPSAGCDLKLVCCDGALMASRCVLCRASSVLRSTLELELPEAGELRLPADKAESWRMALSLLSLEAYPLSLVTSDNVVDLLLLADKYDIPIVRGACAHFLHLNARQLSLVPPLSSASNLLTAASLVIKFVQPYPGLQQYGSTVQARLDDELAMLRMPPDGGCDLGAAGGAQYTDLHTRGCRLCNAPMLPTHARFCNSCAYRKHKKS